MRLRYLTDKIMCAKHPYINLIVVTVWGIQLPWTWDSPAWIPRLSEDLPQSFIIRIQTNNFCNFIHYLFILHCLLFFFFFTFRKISKVFRLRICCLSCLCLSWCFVLWIGSHAILQWYNCPFLWEPFFLNLLPLHLQSEHYERCTKSEAGFLYLAGISGWNIHSIFPETCKTIASCSLVLKNLSRNSIFKPHIWLSHCVIIFCGSRETDVKLCKTLVTGQMLLLIEEKSSCSS